MPEQQPDDVTSTSTSASEPTSKLASVTQREVPVRVRTVPKLGTFACIGAILALIFSITMTVITPASDGLSKMQAFGLLTVWSVPVGVALLLVLGLVLDWASRHRTRAGVAVRERHQQISKSPELVDTPKTREPGSTGLDTTASDVTPVNSEETPQ